MAKKNKKLKYKSLKLRWRKQTVRVLIDRVLLFRYLRNLHNRFWGVAGIGLMTAGFAICFAIRPDLLSLSTAFSDFGNDVRTAPYFAGSVFLGAFGMWRWRNYLARTWKHKMPVTGLVTLTILGLYIVALMPLSWNSNIHMAGMTLAGISMLATVVADQLLSKPTHIKRLQFHWPAIRLASFISIVSGGWITLASSPVLDWYQLSLVGEILMLLGYLLWVSVKTYQGEGNRTRLANMLRKIVLIS